MTDEQPLINRALTRDIEDLLNLIKELEARIAKLERLRDQKINQGDTWYWEHG